MLTGIDHFIVVVQEPDDAAAEIERTLGLRATGGGRHETHGSFNRLIWLGDSYVELLGISDRSLARQAWFGPKALSVLDHASAGYVGLALVSDDLATDSGLLRPGGSALGQPAAGERVRPDGRVVRWQVATLAEPDPELGHLFLIEHDTDAAEWTPAERAERAQQPHPLGGPARLLRVELPVHDMRASTMRLHRDLGVAFRPSLVGGGARDASIGGHVLRLLPARPGSPATPMVVLSGGSVPRDIEVLGLRCLVVPATG